MKQHPLDPHEESLPIPSSPAPGARRPFGVAAWLLVLLAGLAGLAVACAGETAEAPAGTRSDTQPAAESASEAEPEVTYEAAYPDEVSSEGLSDEDARQQAHSHDGEGAHEHGEDGDHAHGEEAGDVHGEDGHPGEDDHSH